jgi:hypothetical protein
MIVLGTAIYNHALRQCGISDKVQGFGPLLIEFRPRLGNDGAPRLNDTASASIAGVTIRG